jgi:hypothetical protein
MKTGVLSWIGTQRQRLAQQGLRQRLRALVLKIVRHLLQAMVRWLDRHPRWRSRLKRSVEALGLRNWLQTLQAPVRPRRAVVLTHRAREILQDLQHAMARRGDH